MRLKRISQRTFILKNHLIPQLVHKLFTGKSKTEKKGNQEAEYTAAGDFLFGGAKRRKESQQAPPEPDKDPNK